MIDINTLTIGSHVLFNGERVEVTEISCGEVVGVVTANESDWHEVMSDRLDPIPITEELLTELGWLKEKRPLEQYILILSSDEYDVVLLKGNNECSVSTKPKDKTFANIFGDIAYCKVQYLHELEAFVYLTTKQRLI